MERLEKLLRERCPELELRVSEPMSKHTTFRIGGPAALMALPRTAVEAKAAVKAVRDLGVEPFFLGNGSNLLVADEGYPGFIIKLTWDFDGIREVNRGLEAGSAVLLPRLSNAAFGWGLTGLEFASGIPGSVGGAVTMNAGAYGGEVAQVLESVTFLDEAGEICTLPASACGFGYRKSIFSDRKCLILKARFHLNQGDPASIRARMEALAAKRREKQPLEYPSAGSMFKRPPGHFAAALIDQCGLKGFTVGGAQVSAKHAGFVINRGDAACADVLELVRQVRERVLAQTGVELELEVKMLGGTV
mgnify:CR=1 FL=1